MTIRSTDPWTWGVIGLSTVVCGAVVWAHFEHRRVLERTVQVVQDVRLARVDLAQGFLHLTLGGEAASPFDRNQGLALFQEATAILRGALQAAGMESGLAGGDAATPAAFERSVEAFRAQLAAWESEKDPQPEAATRLRAAFQDVERHAEAVDRRSQENLGRIARRLSARFGWTLAGAAVSLAALCGAVFVSGRARRRSAAALGDAESRLRTLLAETGRIAHLGGWEFDPATGAGTWTEEVARIHEVDPGATTSAEFGLSFYEGESRARIEAAIKAALEQGVRYDLELELRTAKGNRKWVRSIGQPVIVDDRVVRLRGSFQDITDRKRVEQALRERENQLQLFVDFSPAAIAMFDREMRYIAASRRWYADYKLDDTPLAGRSHYEVFPDIPETWRQVHRRCLAGGVERSDGDPFPRVDGRVDWVRWEARPWHHGSGEIGGIIIFSEVITAEKEAGQALRESEARFRQIAEGLPQLVWTTGPDGTCDYLSRQWENYTGIAAAQQMGGSWLDQIHPEDRQRLTEAWAGAVAAGTVFTSEFRIRRHDGAWRWFDTRAVPLRNEQGQVVKWFGSNTDIHDEKELRETVRRERDRLAKVAASTPGVICSFRLRPDGSACFPFASEVMREVYGLDPAAVADDAGPLFRIVHPDDLAEMRESIAVSARTMRPWRAEFRLLHPQKGERWIEGHSMPAAEPDGGVVWHGYVCDVTERKQAEIDLRRSEAGLETAQAIAHMGSWELDPASGLGTWSREMFRLFGRDPASGVPPVAEFLELVHPEDRTALREGQRRAVESGEAATLTYRVNRPGGAVRHLQTTLSVGEPAGDGRITVAGTVLDITERVLAGNRIQHLNRVYAVLSDINQMIVRVRDPGLILDEACRIAVGKGGFPMAWIGMLDADTRRLVPAGRAGAHEGYVDRLDIAVDDTGLKSPAAQAVRSGRHVVCNDVARDDRLGGWQAEALRRGFRSVSSFPLVVDGQPVGVFNLYSGEVDFFDADELRLLDELAMDVGFAIEIGRREAERRRAEQALRESEGRFRTLIEHASDLITVIDARGVVRFQSPSAGRVLGWRPEEMVGRPVVEFVHPDDADRVRATLRQAEPAAGVVSVGFRVRHRDGSWRHFQSVGKRIPAEQGAEDFVVNSRDTTASDALEQQLRQAQKMEAVGQLAGGVAHDFNNVLTIVMGQVGLLDTEPGLPAIVREASAEIRAAAERAARLTRQLLTFSRQQAMQPCQVDLNEAVTNMARMLRHLLGENIRTELRLWPGDLPVMADTGMLEQVLLNLSINSRDAMPRGGSLTVATELVQFDESLAARVPQARPGSFACLVVTDTGTGIAPENLPHIFEPFFTTKEVGKGTGLGLATVHGIVQQHCGWVEVLSEVGRGTSFRVYLPRLAERARAEEREQRAAPGRAGGEIVLVVEDEPALRSLMRRVLTSFGYRVVEAATAPEALAFWREPHPEVSLVITDVVMPDGMSGFDLGERLRQEAPQLRVVYMSGYSADIAGRRDALTVGVNFLPKPFDVDSLLAAVRAALDAPAR